VSEPVDQQGERPGERTAAVVGALAARGQTVATAESLTGGLLCAALVDVPGASAVVRGGVVAYAAECKSTVLGVPAEVVGTHGAVAAETALRMAGRARELFGADWGVATTGVAGPDPAEGQPPGRAYVAVAGRDRLVHRRLDLGGQRADVRAGTVRAALVLMLSEIEKSG